jgi:hypothetical protein
MPKESTQKKKTKKQSEQSSGDVSQSQEVQEVKIRCAYNAIKDIAEIVPHPQNPNQHPTHQIKLLAKIIAFQGWRSPIVVSKRSGFVTKGHGRLAAAKILGLSAVPVDFQEYDSEAQEMADIYADNQIASYAEMNEELIKATLAEFDTGEIPLEMFGFQGADLEKYLAPIVPPDEKGRLLSVLDCTIEEPKHKVCRKDVYRVGKHILLCASPFKDWKHWKDYLQDEKDLFCPFPGVFVAICKHDKYERYVMVQPDPYICGHILDRYAEANGSHEISVISKADPDEVQDEDDEPFSE